LRPALLTPGALDLRIGGVVLRLTTLGSTEVLAAHAAKYVAFDASAQAAEADDLEAVLTVRCTPGLVLPTLGPTPVGYQRADLRFDVRSDGADGHVDESEGAFDAVLELLLQATLHRHDGFVVHASAGVDAHGGAWLCPGPSGAGKSTFARSAGFARVLADEAVVVRRHADGWRVHGTPFWSEGRTHPHDPGHAPLARLVRPVKDPTNVLVEISKAHAAAHLLESILLHDDTPGLRARLFDRACDVASATDCYDVHFPKEGPWLSGVKERRAEWAASSAMRSNARSLSSFSGT